MEEFFEVRFANSEQEFIYNSGVNKGHTQVPDKITMCYFLNSSEKSLYDLLTRFMYGDKRTCFPSIEMLLGISGWSRTTFKKHVDGLKKAHIIDYIVREGTTNEYILEELHKSTLIVHSELLHQIRETHFKRTVAKFNELKAKYVESELYAEVSTSINPLEYEGVLEHWFLSSGGQEVLDEVKPSIEETPTEGQPKRFLPNTSISKGLMGISDGMNKVADPDKQVKGKKKKPSDFNKLSIEEWNCNHFSSFFDDIYQRKMNFVMPSHKGDTAQLKALIERYGNEKLKERIELFFNTDSFQHMKKNIYSFSSANVQSKIDKILNFGDSNSYKAKGKKYKASEQSQLDQWMKDIKAKE